MEDITVGDWWISRKFRGQQSFRDHLIERSERPIMSVVILNLDRCDRLHVLQSRCLVAPAKRCSPPGTRCARQHADDKNTEQAGECEADQDSLGNVGHDERSGAAEASHHVHAAEPAKVNNYSYYCFRMICAALVHTIAARAGRLAGNSSRTKERFCD